MLDAPFQLRIGVRKMPADVAERRGAEHRVGRGVAHDVGIGVPERAALATGWSRRRGPAAGLRPAGAGRSRCRRAPCRGRCRSAACARALEIRGGRDLHVGGSPSTTRHGCPARSASAASSVASTPARPSATASAQHLAAERLRRLRQVDRLARQRLDDHGAVADPATRFTVSRDRHRGDRRAVRRGGVDRPR